MCVCVGGGGGGGSVLVRIILSAPPLSDPGSFSLSDSWLKLTAALECLVYEFRVSFDGITQCLSKLFPCRGFAHLSLCNYVEQAKARFLSVVHVYLECEDTARCGWVETAKQNGEVSVMDERKIDQVVSELDRYHVVVGTLQETRWFGREVYRVGESVVLIDSL